MQQLRVYPNDSRIKEEGQILDLYKDDPIKLTLSVEDILTAEASSVFSKTFRVPANSNNNKFFKHAFLIDGIDYDVTVKKSADILVDGAEFKTGHIRLEKIYVNEQEDVIDYEILFLGETRDFSSKIGDTSMSNLNIPELQHELTSANIIQSWQAFPEGADGDGLFNGDVLYPLIDHGNTYENGMVQEPRISMVGNNRFTSSGHPIGPERFKPMIRAKRLWDQIFEDAGYTYQSQFLTSNIFRRLYVSAFGNKADIDLNLDETSINNMEFTDINVDSRYEPLPFKLPISDPGNNLDLLNSAYIVPITGTYTMEASLTALVYEVVSLGGGRLRRDYKEARIDVVLNGTTVIASGPYAVAPDILTLNTTLSLTQGDSIQLWISSPYVFTDVETWNRIWKVTGSPGEFNPISSLDNDYKQIEFIRDILTTFRLVMSPHPFIPNRFNIEPYVTYINTGTTRDWSNKLIRDKDRQIEPLFNTQTDRIEFRFTPDGDWINKYHQDAFKNPYGYLAFDSNNDLLKGTRKIDVKFAPTPLARIQGAPNTSSWIIPQLLTHEAGDEGLEHRPIKPKTRLLFYNGLKPTDVPWHLTGIMGHLEEYPAVTPYENFPQTETGLNLNWFNDVKYWGSNVPGYQTDGVTLFQRYWSTYIADLYNTQARRVTGYFTLNNNDLQGFAFNDVIFVDGVYYTPEKIIDAPIGDLSSVKVELIKANNFRPVDFQQPMLYALQPHAPTCFGDIDGSLDIIVTNGIPPYSYELSNGRTGFFGSTEYTLQDIEPGTYSITITENSGYSRNVAFIIPEAIEITVTQVISNENPVGANNGEITIIPSGGVGPYTILWSDGNTDLHRTGLSGGTYTYTLSDSNGCEYNGSAEVLSGVQNLGVNVEITNPSNCGIADGEINLIPFGGIPPYTIQWADGPTTEDRTGLIEGTYYFTLTDSVSNQVGPQDILLECFAPAYPIELSEGFGTAGDACLYHYQGFVSQYWADSDPITIGTKLYYSPTGAQQQDPNDLVFDDYFSDGTNAYEVVNGIVVNIELCDIIQVYTHDFTARYFLQSDACADANFQNNLYGYCEIPEIGCELFITEQAVIEMDYDLLAPDGWYGYIIEGPLGGVSFRIEGGIVQEMIDC